MVLDDYLIEHSEIDWPNVLSPWHWLLPEEFTVWLMNRFGDLFVVLDDSSVWMFDVGGGSFEQVASCRDEFYDSIENDETANQWLMIPLIDHLVAAGKHVSPKRCYGYIIPPVLGGEYTAKNTSLISIDEHYSFHASVYEQIKDMPDGTAVKIKIVP